jgi:hypothetical protein
MLKLVKTDGGGNGAPGSCPVCGGTSMVRSRISWNCTNCYKHFPINLNAPNAVEKLKLDLEVLQALGKEFRKAIDDLERIIK